MDATRFAGAAAAWIEFWAADPTLGRFRASIFVAAALALVFRIEGNAAKLLVCVEGESDSVVKMASHFTLHNMEDGFVEAFLRGLRSTFLTDMEYSNLKEGGRRGGSGGEKAKEDFEDLRLTLQETDYGNFLQAEVRKGAKSVAG